MLRLFLFLCWLCASPCFAWNALGHQVIAQIALDQLTPQAKQRTQRLLSQLSRHHHATNLVASATWLDDVRWHDVSVFDHWHYINYRLLSSGRSDFRVAGDNIVWALAAAQQVLGSPRSKPVEKALFLRVLVHLVADIHQPLHCASRVSTAHPDGDRGGNLHSITDEHYANLHAFWDAGLGLWETSARGLAKRWQIRRLANQLEKRYRRPQFRTRLSQTAPSSWAQESFALAKNTVYRLREGESPSFAYRRRGQALAASQAALAGYRLADTLNAIFSD